MQITQLLAWPVVNWPGTAAATQYTVTRMYPTEQHVTDVATNSASISYDEAASLVFQIRPTSGTYPALTYGPEVLTYVNQYVACRAYIRQLVRKSLGDRSDKVKGSVLWPDDEIDSYIARAIVELNQLFPVEKSTTITLIQGQRNYPVPSDFAYARSVEFVSNAGNLHLYLKEKPFRGGESTATSYVGYSKLGAIASPLTGRFYPGHYYVYEQELWIDFDPTSSTNTITIKYAGNRPLPVSDAEVLAFEQPDIELVSLRTQVFCWLRIESSDVKISRWTEEKKRDDLPTARMSTEIQKMYNGAVIDRKEKRPVVRRLVRR